MTGVQTCALPIYGNTASGGQAKASGLFIKGASSVTNNVLYNNTGHSYALRFYDTYDSFDFTENIIADGLTYFSGTEVKESFTNNVFAGGVSGNLELSDNDAEFSKNVILNGSGNNLRIYGGSDYEINQTVYFSKNLFSGN